MPKCIAYTGPKSEGQDRVFTLQVSRLFSPMQLEHLLFIWSAQWLAMGIQACIQLHIVSP